LREARSALLGYALWRAFVASREASGLEATTLHEAFMMVLMMALHSSARVSAVVRAFPAADGAGVRVVSGRGGEGEDAGFRRAPGVCRNDIGLFTRDCRFTT